MSVGNTFPLQSSYFLNMRQAVALLAVYGGISGSDRNADRTLDQSILAFLSVVK